MSALSQEWRVVSRERGAQWSVLVLLALAALCLWNGFSFKTQRDEAASAEIARSLEARARDAQTVRAEEAGEQPRNAWGPSNVTRANWNVARPSGPLAMLSFGREDIEPASANVSLWMVREDNLFRKYEFGSPLAIAAGRFDAGFLVVLLLPLFVLALTYNVVAQERESGRLRLMLVQGKSVASRFALRGVLRLLPVWLTLGAIGVGAWWLGAPPDRLGLWMAGALLYVLFWVGLSMALATLRLRQEVLALTAAGLWLLVVVLVPAAGAGVARSVAPTPLEASLIVQAREASIEANRRLLENLQGYVSDHPELMDNPNADDWAAKLYVSQILIEEQVAPVLSDHAAMKARQLAWSQRMTAFSPASIADRVLTNIAGTGRDRQAAFVAQTLGFLRAWRERFAPWIFARRSLHSGEIDALPTFEFREPAPVHAIPLLWILSGFAIASVGIAALCLTKVGTVRS